MLYVRVPYDLHNWLKVHAAENDTNMSAIILSYLARLQARHTRGAVQEV